VLLPQFGTSTYFLLALLALVDFLSGIALRARRGTQMAAAASRRGARAPEVLAPEPHFDPAPAAAPPPAASVAESVRLDHPEPTPAQPNVGSTAPSPEIPSPGLQPGHGTTPPPDAPPR